MFDPKKLMDMMKQASGLQAKVQEELKQKRVEGTAGGGMVNVTLNGQFDVLELKIDPSVVKMDDIAFLEDLIQAAMNDGVRNARDAMKDHMSTLTSQFGLPFGK